MPHLGSQQSRILCINCMKYSLLVDYQCAAHVMSCVIKRLATSTTMNVAEVSTLYECLRTVVKHFESTIQNKELLDEAIEILELQPLHLISWSQTRMGHFLKACKVFDDMLQLYMIQCIQKELELTKGIFCLQQRISL